MEEDGYEMDVWIDECITDIVYTHLFDPCDKLWQECIPLLVNYILRKITLLP